MKKLLSVLLVLVLSVTMAVPAFAANSFVPSITYKDGPDLTGASMNGENLAGCIVVTSIAKAKNKSTEISQAERDLLLDLYDQLNSGAMKLPIANDKYVIRELVDVSFAQSACVNVHSHEDELNKANTTISITFDLGVKSSAEVLVYVYVDGKWVAAEQVTNLGNGRVTVVFENIGPVAFCVNKDSQITPPQTGDTAGSQLFMWGTIMAGSIAALLILVVVVKRRKGEKE